MIMDKNDLAALLVGAPADEVDRIHRLLYEWSVGPDNSFPVQLALLTKAQWRVAANLPRLMNDASKLIEKHLAEYRRQTGAIVANFDDRSSTTIAAFDQSIANHSEVIKQVVAKSNGHLAETEKAARQLHFELEHGNASLKKALDEVRKELIDERFRLIEAQKALDARMSFQAWWARILWSIGELLIGFGIYFIWSDRR
jgi:hypothetical protein